MAKLAPSLLSANFSNLENDIKLLDKCQVEYLHLDVMDGNFVPNISFGPGLIKSIRPLTSMVFDTHLMVESPERYIEDFAEAGSDILTIHYEATRHVDRTIDEIRKHGMKAGVSLNPASPLCFLDHILEKLDLVLIMSVNPGFGGQSFIDPIKEKISALNKIKKERDLDFIIEVDGGIKTSNVKEIKELGADLLVSGSDVFGAADIEQRIKEYKEILDE